MKHITKITIGLITIALVGYSKYESEISTNVSTKISISNPIFTARQDNTPLSRSALNRLAENITVEIVTPSVTTGGGRFTPAGSGVIIGKQDSTYYVLTAEHIFPDQNDYRVVVRSKKPGEDAEVVKLQILRRYPKQDLAVVKFASLKKYKVVEVGEASQLSNNSQVYVGGWPGVENREGFQFTPAKVTNPRAGDNLTYEPTEPGEGVYKGMSGGAVLSEAGQLVGIHVQLTEVDGDGEGVLISTFLREMPQEVSRVLVKPTSVASPSRTRENQTVRNYANPTPVASPSWTRENQAVTNAGNPIPVISTSPTRENQTLRNSANPTLSQSQNAAIYISQGIIYTIQGQYDKAIADFNQAIRLNPKYAEVYIARGAAYGIQGKYEKALTDFNQAIRLNPKHAEAYNGRASVYYEQGEYEKAIADFNQAIRLNPKHAEAYNGRASVYYEQGEYEKAIADLNQAIRLNPKHADVYNYRGIVYRKQREYEKAIADYNQAIQLNPKYPEAYNNRGIVYRKQGKYEKAIADYNQAIQLNPKYAHAYYNRGLTYKANKNIEKAISDFEKAADLYKQQANQEDYQDSLDQLKELRGY
ncbi:MAG: serine protease [Okeania sp. SIO2C9]|uniref:tetratricopeptide repeat-containing S1 family peptidase n=1 Tax=Okeania sp. SIO2C9 TaxID=2607791 RepID=UPI0013BF07A9|nr:tetratricopeptide repeat-containing serine protease family protein [Okeania sp. SIO2C9]NEQ75011.1 serine protease [Okeania sp. SIO2C9]